MTELIVGAIMQGGPRDKRYEAICRAYMPEGIAPTVTAGGGGGVEPKVVLFEGWDDSETKGERKLTQTNEVTYEGKPFNYVSLFSGIGGFETALNRLGGTCVLASEIDKFANQSYAALYGEPTAGDITKIQAEDVPDHDVLVGGFPCQAFSVAGKRLGFDDTRGTLFFEVARLAKTKQPRAILLENVKGLVGHDGGKTLDVIVQTLNDIGYHVDFNVLNSKYFGVPQNRERIFIVALRDDIVEPSDWIIEGTNVVAKGRRRIAAYEGTKTFNFDWPEQTEVTTRLRDILEATVDERYYLSEEKTAKLVAQLESIDSPRVLSPQRTEYGKAIRKAYESGEVWESRHNMRVMRPREDEISNTLTTVLKDNHLVEPQLEGLPIREATKQGYSIAAVGDAVNFQFPDSMTRRGRVGKQIANTLEASNINQGVVEAEEVRPVLTPDRIEKRQNGRRFKDNDEESFTLTSIDRHGVAIGQQPKYRIRKLTPLECWRLQGFTDAQHQTVVDAGLSDSQRYKQAGNAVTVNVIQAIGERILTLLDGR